jgi:chemotaxis protein MotB
MRPVHNYLLIFVSAPALLFTSCVSTGKYKAMQQEATKNDSLYTWSQRTLKASQDANADLSKQKNALQNDNNDLSLQLNASKDNVTMLRKQLKDLSALSSAQAESISKSLDNLTAKDAYLRDLQWAVSHRDSLNLAILMNLKASIGGYAEDVNIQVEKGTLYVNLSDRILFDGDSNTYILNTKAKAVLARLARVLNDNPTVQVMVEGNTDSIAYPQPPLLDNWDLSAKRATSVVRSLTEYGVAPTRLIASARAEFLPLAANDSAEGRTANRRTRIVILPDMEPVLRLLERRGWQTSSKKSPSPTPDTSTPASAPAAPAPTSTAPTTTTTEQ